LVGVRMGGGAYEELLFRWLLYSLVFWLTRRAGLKLGMAEDGATLSAELLAIALSASAFAAAHLEGVVYLFTGWAGGEAYHPAIFAWRLLAGVLLAILFRWRGLGVAAWTHAFFNLALSIGAGVDVFL
jgi:Type II CAAX prenyl endopeptidase Rce1-like